MSAVIGGQTPAADGPRDRGDMSSHHRRGQSIHGAFADPDAELPVGSAVARPPGRTLSGGGRVSRGGRDPQPLTPERFLHRHARACQHHVPHDDGLGLDRGAPRGRGHHHYVGTGVGPGLVGGGYCLRGVYGAPWSKSKSDVA